MKKKKRKITHKEALHAHETKFLHSSICSSTRSPLQRAQKCNKKRENEITKILSRDTYTRIHTYIERISHCSSNSSSVSLFANEGSRARRARRLLNEARERAHARLRAGGGGGERRDELERRKERLDESEREREEDTEMNGRARSRHLPGKEVRARWRGMRASGLRGGIILPRARASQIDIFVEDAGGSEGCIVGAKGWNARGACV